MALFSHKKKRGTRATPLRSSSLSARLGELFTNRSTVLRLLLCLLAVVLMIVAVEGWKASFSYRLGDVARGAITARIDFVRDDPAETERLKAEAEATEPFVFRHDPQMLDRLADEFRADLVQVAEANAMKDLPPKTRDAFGLARADDAPSVRLMKHPDFMALKAAVSQEEGTAGDRIDTLLNEFKRFIAPLRRTGLIDAGGLANSGMTSGSAVAVVGLENRGSPIVVSQDTVKKSEVAKDTGLLGKHWKSFSDLVVCREMVDHWFLARAPVTLRFDSEATKTAQRAARERVEVVSFQYHKGDVLVAPGQTIDRERLPLLEAEYAQIERTVGSAQRIIRIVTVFLLILVLAVLNGYHLIHNEPVLVKSFARLSIYFGMLIFTVAISRHLSFNMWRAEVLPLMATVMIIAIVYNQELAMLSAFTLSLIVALSTRQDLGHFVVLMSVTVTAIVALARVASRSTLIKVGFWSGLVYFVVSLGTGIIQAGSLGEVWSDPHLLIDSLRGIFWCLVSGFLVAGSLPFIESAFGVVTDISLLEMSDVSHPLLRELVGRAPGTYNHSISVASIGEAAADRIGANGLLVRVGAYFHDIGKMLKPQYFIENITEGTESRHEHLAPAMSTLIIIGHVKDGVDLADQHNLPRRLIDFIEQHHGTTLVEYFYHEAAKQADQQPDHKTDAEESSFRYPGPKPQTRETGVMMLADAVESASRTLSEPTPKRIESLVHEVTMKRLLDGQFDECALTLSEIHMVEESLTKSLIGIHHGRVKYPEQRTA